MRSTALFLCALRPRRKVRRMRRNSVIFVYECDGGHRLSRDELFDARIVQDKRPSVCSTRIIYNFYKQILNRVYTKSSHRKEREKLPRRRMESCRSQLRRKLLQWIFLQSGRSVSRKKHEAASIMSAFTVNVFPVCVIMGTAFTTLSSVEQGNNLDCCFGAATPLLFWDTNNTAMSMIRI